MNSFANPGDFFFTGLGERLNPGIAPVSPRENVSGFKAAGFIILNANSNTGRTSGRTMQSRRRSGVLESGGLTEAPRLHRFYFPGTDVLILPCFSEENGMA